MTVIQVHVPDDEGQRVHQNDDENRDRDNDDNDDVRVVSWNHQTAWWVGDYYITGLHVEVAHEHADRDSSHTLQYVKLCVSTLTGVLCWLVWTELAVEATGRSVGRRQSVLRTPVHAHIT